jgi:hypothetical protein
VATIVQALGVHLGNDLNGPLDNLGFTLLFKRPRRFAHGAGLVPADDDLAEACLDAFVAAMTHRRPTPWRLAHVARAVLDVGARPGGGDVFEPHDRHSVRSRAGSALRRARRLVANMADKAPEPARWGWKEPNSFVFLPVLQRHLPRLRYVHVVRNGLDMAYSANDTQLRNWGQRFGVGPPTPTGSAEADRLRYWARANAAVADHLDDHGNGLIVRYEDVVGEPDAAVRRLAAAVELAVTDEALALAQHLSPSASTGRHRDQDVAGLLAAAGDEVHAALRRFGYAPGEAGPAL